MKKQKIIVILGQTASGKSDLAVKMAKNFNGEIISADSRQVYKNLNIGTGKITSKEMKEVPHYLLDVRNPKTRFSVAEYQKLANIKIKEILTRNKMPIICGGTGLYIDAITKGIVFPEVPPNLKFRKSLETETTEKLFDLLKKLDPKRAASIESKNKVRLIRAIEIIKILGKVPEIKETKPLYAFIKIGLYIPKDLLRKKIEKRVLRMFKLGLLNEIQKLKKIGISKHKLREFGFEYNNPTQEKVAKESVKYAKRQMTWFKRDKKIKWFNSEDFEIYEKIKEYISAKI